MTGPEGGQPGREAGGVVCHVANVGLEWASNGPRMGREPARGLWPARALDEGMKAEGVTGNHKGTNRAVSLGMIPDGTAGRGGDTGALDTRRERAKPRYPRMYLKQWTGARQAAA